MQSFIDRGVKYYPIYAAKANAQAAAGKQAEADATMKEAMALPDVTAQQLTGYGRQLIRQKREKDAMVVFEANNKRFPNNSAALLGMAFGYDATGDKKNALKFAQSALKAEPTPQGKTQIEGLIKKLEAGESINS
jgi:tetratricopeptide (TPR) repeat protein